MQAQDKVYTSYQPTSFAAAAAGAVGGSASVASGSSAKGPAPAEAPTANGTSAAGFDAIKRSFEGTQVTGATPNGTPGPLVGSAPETNGSSFPVVGQAGFPAPNGLYGAAFVVAAGYPQQQQPQHSVAANGTSPAANGGTFSAATSPFLAHPSPGANGVTSAAPLPFGSPVPSAAGPYSGSAFDATPTSPNPYGGPPLPAQGGPGPFGQPMTPVPGLGGLGAASPYMMSPMLGMNSPQVGGGNGFGMPYPISGAQQQGNFSNSSIPQNSTVSNSASSVARRTDGLAC